MSEKQKRGLFKTIFGKSSQESSAYGYSQFSLLSTGDAQFESYSGNAWDIATVRAAVDAFARNAAKAQPRHIRRTSDTREDVKDGINRLLQFKPNPYMSAYAFYYRVATQYCIYNNAFIFPV